MKKNTCVKSEATINIYFRSLRAIYNYAEVNLDIDHKHNPFGRNKIVIASNSNIKRAINERDFQKFLLYKPLNSKEEFAHDMFLVSFGLAGMNIADIISIKNNNIEKDILTYHRKKTEKRQKDATLIRIKIDKPVMDIIKKHGYINPDSPNDYIFPFFNSSMTEKQELRKRKDITKNINKSLKEICNNIKIEKITTYTARHTIATMLMNSGVKVEAISKSLGHSNIKVTQNYLSQLSDKVMNDIADKTSSFMRVTNEKSDAEGTVTTDPIIVD